MNSHNSPQGKTYRPAYDALMRDLLQRAAVRIAAQEKTADVDETSAAPEVRDAAAQPSS